MLDSNGIISMSRLITGASHLTPLVPCLTISTPAVTTCDESRQPSHNVTAGLSLPATQEGKMIKVCATCGQEFKTSHAKTAYCSRACMGEGYKTRFSGDGNPNYSDAGWKTCIQCGVTFHRYNSTAKYCSDKCKGLNPINLAQLRKAAHAPKTKKNEHTRNCVCSRCGASFVAPTKRRVCDACDLKRQPPAHICAACGKTFYAYGTRKNCSPECVNTHKAIRQRGAQSHRWQGGKTDTTTLFRNSQEYALWRNAVFARDDYTCLLCNERGGKLAAHHIRPFATYPEIRLAVGNGATLCWSCHASIKGRESRYETTFYDITGFKP